VAETLSYSVVRDHKTIGQIRIQRTINKNETDYFFESTVKLRVLVNIEVYDRMKVKFRGGQMIQSQLYRTLNGRVRVDNKTTWNGRGYDIVDEGKHQKVMPQIIRLSTASLYYHEPEKSQMVFSEKFQQMVPIKHLGNRRYQLNLPNGNQTRFTYANGICKLVEAETDWANLQFVLNEKVQ
jgi:hypothetical protein